MVSPALLRARRRAYPLRARGMRRQPPPGTLPPGRLHYFRVRRGKRTISNASYGGGKDHATCRWQVGRGCWRSLASVLHGKGVPPKFLPPAAPHLLGYRMNDILLLYESFFGAYLKKRQHPPFPTAPRAVCGTGSARFPRVARRRARLGGSVLLNFRVWRHGKGVPPKFFFPPPPPTLLGCAEVQLLYWRILLSAGAKEMGGRREGRNFGV